jgi:peptide-methionine (R)-S-oxide reductase
MFESDGGGREVNLGRRLFLSGLGAALGGAALFSLRRPHVIAEAAKTEPAEVTVVQFSDSGKRLAKMKVARVVKTEEEWRKQLPSGAFEITRHADTELAYSGKLLNVHDRGIFRCICCDNALFSSSTTAALGWYGPQFLAPSVTRTWVTCSTMVRSRPDCDTA